MTYMKMKKYSTEDLKGIIPAFYAAYDGEGRVSEKGIRAEVRYFLEKGVNGLYVGGSSGECIYLSPTEREQTLEIVMDELQGRLPVIAHVACQNTLDSECLARHAEKLGVTAIAAIPPIYFKLPPHAIAAYWNAISAAAPETPFIIYNIPQLAGVALSDDLLREMLKNERVAGVKNSSAPVEDISRFRRIGEEAGRTLRIFNGPDEQLCSGLAAGACGGIGGTYGAFPELYLAIWAAFQKGELDRARRLQDEALQMIHLLCSAHGNLYAVIKACLRLKGGPDLGSVRPPLPALIPEDEAIVREAYDFISEHAECLKKQMA